MRPSRSGLYKFTAYKDEYEVARLLTDPLFVEQVRAEIPAGENLTYRLHPPVLRALGRTKKIGLTPRSHALLRLVAKGKRLRGSVFDPFGYAHVRQVERGLLAEYSDVVIEQAAGLSEATYDRAVEIASLADVVRGYEDRQTRQRRHLPRPARRTRHRPVEAAPPMRY